MSRYVRHDKLETFNRTLKSARQDTEGTLGITIKCPFVSLFVTSNVCEKSLQGAVPQICTAGT